MLTLDMFHRNADGSLTGLAFSTAKQMVGVKATVMPSGSVGSYFTDVCGNEWKLGTTRTQDHFN